MITSQKDCLLPLGISETGRDLKIVCERENLGIRPVYVGIYSSSSLDTTLSNNIFLVLYLIRTKLLKDSQFCCALWKECFHARTILRSDMLLQLSHVHVHKDHYCSVNICEWSFNLISCINPGQTN